MRCPTLMALLAGVMLYLVMGALVFRWLEAPKESSDYEKLRRNRRTFLHNHTCVTEEDLGQLIKVGPTHTHTHTQDRKSVV